MTQPKENLPPERIHVRYNAAEVAEPFYAIGVEPACNATYTEANIFDFLKQLRNGRNGVNFSIVTCWPYGKNENEPGLRLAIDAVSEPALLLRNRHEPGFQDWYRPAAFQLEPERNILKCKPSIFTEHDGDLYFDLVRSITHPQTGIV